MKASTPGIPFAIARALENQVFFLSLNRAGADLWQFAVLPALAG